MADFITAALQFPTVVFTVLLLAFVAYAMLMATGLVGLHSFDSALGIDAHHDAIADSLGHHTFLEDALNTLGVSGIPLTIFGGVAVVFGWITSFFGMYFFGDALENVWLSSLFGLGCITAGALLGSVVVRPLRPIFKTVGAPGRRSLVGKTCTIRSLRVDEKAGTAEVDDGGAGFIAEVRCLRANTLTRGQKALVYSYEEDDGTYHVVPLDLPLVDETSTSAARAVQKQM